MTPGGAQPRSPYRGILPFRYEDRALFFGRQPEVNELKAKILLYRLVVLFGESGSGKSSLLNAGIVPALQTEGFQPERLRVRPFEDEPILVERIRAGEADGFLPSAFIDGTGATAPQIACSLERFQHIATDRRPAAVPVLIFDQFEELFTLFESGQRTLQDAMLGVLYELFNSRELLAKVVIAIREDFLAKLEVLARQYPQVFDRRVRLGLLSSDAARQAITGAFQQDHGFPSEVTAGAAEAIISGFTQGSGEPAIHSTQLQIVCSRLWDDCAERKQQIEASDVHERGGVKGILEGFLESEMRRLPSDQQADAYRLLGQLVTSSGTRDVVSEDRLRGLLRGDGPDDGIAMKATLEFLEAQRLVNRTSQRSTYYYEVSSEYLIGPIQTYNTVRVRDEAARRAAQAAADAERESTRERELEHARQLADVERQRAALQAKSARRLRRGLAALFMACVAALATTLYAYQQRRLALREAALATAAANDLKKAQELSARRYSVYRTTVEVKQNALSGKLDLVEKALQASPGRVAFDVTASSRGYNGPNGPVYLYEFSPRSETVPNGLDALALITYKLDHPTFKNSILAAGPDREFKASYDGWGCLDRVIAVVEYRDPDRQAEAALFNMCELVRYQ